MTVSRFPKPPKDILAQQLVATAANGEWSEEELYALVLRAYPYRHLSRETFDAVVEMLAEGVTKRSGRSRRHLHHDRINGRIRARPGARLTALTCGGAIPDTADYRVVTDGEPVLAR